MEWPGYTDFELISETLNSIVYRARQAETRQAVVIKVFKIDTPSPSEIARFRHEYAMIRKADLEGVVKVLEIISTGDRFALVMEDFGGISLQRYMKGVLGPGPFLEMAVRLADILQQLHQRNITHRDIKPSNILYNPETDVLKVTDFGIASEIVWPHEDANASRLLEGSLAYMSPEQTGRMNCEVDYRTDFYSLGVTFYEMVTGRTPFTSQDPMEIIHAHIARKPVPPESLNPDLPRMVSDIILRLLAKSADERYQSAPGLLTDLAECRRRLEATGRIEPFEIGARDISPRFNIPQVLVGREEELEILYAAFERVGRGSAEALMVAGEPGIGKSALVKEIQKPVVARRGYFITGKYDPLRQGVPFSAVIQAVQGLARQVLAENQERIEAWKEKLLAALGPNGRVITDIIAEIELIIGRQPPIPELVLEEAQNRFKLVLKKFVQVFAGREHPLVLFLDDLQWADPASLDLIQTLMLDRDLGAFLFIGAFRENEVAAHHPLSLALERMESAGVPVGTISVGALAPGDVDRLMANFLRCRAEVSSPLAAIVHQKTLGNPFFINQFLKRLYENRHLVLDPAVGWQWDAAEIQKLAVTENVVAFMAERLRDLPADPLSLIRIAACIGNRFDAEMLSFVAGKTLEDVLAGIDTLVQEGLLTCMGRLYRFHHDRIHEAAYSLLLPEEKTLLHYRIGRMLLAGTSEEDLIYQVFYIADQLNNARVLLKSEEERLQLAGINLKAGVKAKDSTAYEAAAAYLNAGIDLLPRGAWQTHYRLAYDLHLEQMGCQYLARNFDESERLFAILVANAADRIDKANAYNTMIVLYTNTRPPEDAIALGISALKLFGIRIDPKMGPAKVLMELFKARMKLRKMALEDILALPPMADGERLAYHRLLFNIGTPAYFVNPNLFAFLVLTGINESFRYGLPPHAAITFLSLATILENVLEDYALGYEMGRMALKLNRKLGNRKLAGMVNHIFAFFIQHWNTHARHDLPVYRKVYRLCMESGNFIYAGHSVNAAADCRLVVGEPLDDIRKENEQYQELMEQVKDPFIAARYAENNQLIRCLNGLSPSPTRLAGEGVDEEAHLARLRAENNVYGLTFTLLNQAKLLYLFGQYEAARQAAAELDRHIKVPFGTLIVSEHYYYYSLILAALLQGADALRRGRIKWIIRRNQRKLAKWAALCPENFRHKHDLVQAELAAAGRRFRKAQVHYHGAIRGARQNEYVNDEALTCERLAVFYHRMGALEEARTFIERAHQCYGHWGAAAKQAHIEKHWQDLLPASYAASGGDARTGPNDTTSRNLDLAAVMKVSQAISGEIMLDQLLKKTMQLSITNAGAERGFLILPEDGRLVVEACEAPQGGEDSMALPVPLARCQGLAHSIVQFVFRSREPVILAHAARQGPFTGDPHIMHRQCKSILCMPIMNKGRLSGILYMENNLTANAFTEERLEILGIIASQAAISLENARLFDLATTDGLTKLFVHRYFQFLLDQEIERSRRYHHPFSLVMMDIDDFKHFNDTYGHPLGDEVLRGVARVVRSHIRPADVAARYGGEELVLILPETDLPQALAAGEKIRGLVEKMPIPFEGKGLKVTISLGVAVFPHHATHKGDLIRAADGALYASKRAGKNRVSVAEGKPSPADRQPAVPSLSPRGHTDPSSG